MQGESELGVDEATGLARLRDACQPTKKMWIVCGLLTIYVLAHSGRLVTGSWSAGDKETFETAIPFQR
jgi:hypothetical protein